MRDREDPELIAYLEENAYADATTAHLKPCGEAFRRDQGRVQGDLSVPSGQGRGGITRGLSRVSSMPCTPLSPTPPRRRPTQP